MTRAPSANPSLQAGQLDLELGELLLEFLAGHLAGRAARLGCLVLLLLVFRHLECSLSTTRSNSLASPRWSSPLRQARAGTA